jgi:predicted GNAT family acetyltransferase
VDARAFLDRAAQRLAAEEARYGLILGISRRLVDDPHEYGSEEPWFLILEDDGELAGLALRTPPFNILVAAFSGDTPEVAPVMVTEAASTFDALPGVVGEPEIADSFAEGWCALRRVKVGHTMRQRIYRLTEVKPIPLSPGELRLAGESDLELITGWAMGFQEATFGQAEVDRVAGRVAKQVARGEIFLWVDGEPVSMASKARPSGNAVSVGMVYTPPNLRKRGYASSCVAALCGVLLKKGFTYCTLYTDLSNPTSNKIYKRIGFEEVCDSVAHTFTGPGTLGS